MAPAYDLTLSKGGYHGERATSVNFNGKPSIKDMIIVGETIRIPRKKGLELIQSIIDNCQEILSNEFMTYRKGH